MTPPPPNDELRTVPGQADVGREWIYCLRDYSRSERVRVLAIDTRPRSVRVDVEFLDGEKAGQRENIPSGRLRGPWSSVQRYDELMGNWSRLAAEGDISEPEEWAIDTVFELLIPDEIATCWGQQVKEVTVVHDRIGFEKLIGTTLDEITAAVASFELDGTLILSPAGSLMVAELACLHNPAPILDWVMEAEEKARDLCISGRKFQAHDRSGECTSDPEWEYKWYIEHDRPQHELLRQWCGHRAVTTYERVTAAEAEVLRLDRIVRRLLDVVRDHNHILAEVIEREHETERITPANVRPEIERPKHPSEMPVRIIKVRAPRWW
ncbi:hypothetical protein [Nocardia terpenica]|uniref:hypothetical protein n=1 Tax=Nocardia terpenica TaxID=455432 RepID=UPI0012E8B244|nr:hypothetical protein [Nocardia terpenica]NQE90264.1 hypothetical protein [Nocardia terpenica]